MLYPLTLNEATQTIFPESHLWVKSELFHNGTKVVVEDLVMKNQAGISNNAAGTKLDSGRTFILGRNHACPLMENEL